MTIETTVRRAPVRLAVAAAVGLVVGVATSYLQGVLPGPTNFLANSGAVWTAVAFLLACWVLRGSPPGIPLAMSAGIGALVGEVLGYYAIASPLRGIATTPAEQTLWIAAGFVFGAAAGVVARAVVTDSPWRAPAAGAVCGLFAGEGLHAAVALGHATQAAIELALGALGLVVTFLLVPRSVRAVVTAVAATLAVAAVVALAYSVV